MPSNPSSLTSRQELANAIRALSMDAVQQANSGHPGVPMGMADIAQVLWTDFLKHNPTNPNYAERGRLILFWYKYVGVNGKVIGMTTFGEAALADQLFECLVSLLRTWYKPQPIYN